MKVGSFSFGSPVSASALSKPIFDIKATDDKNKISTPMLSESVKTSYLLVIWLKAPHQKSAVVGLPLIPVQADQEVLSFDHQFVGLGLQGQPGGSSVRNIFEGSLTEEITGSVKAIFEGGLKFAASESRNKLDSTA